MPTGTVVSFEEGRGLGSISADDGREYPFHCTQIADGSRTIAVGTPVRFERRPWHRGEWEATRIEPAG